MRVIAQTGENIAVYEVTIPAGAAVSEAFESNGLTPIGVFMPAAWTTANLAILGSVNGGSTTFRAPTTDVNGARIQHAVAADAWVSLVGNDKLLAPWLQVASVDGSGVAVNQLAAAVIQLVMARRLS